MSKIIVMIAHHNLKRGYIYRISMEALQKVKGSIDTFEGELEELYDRFISLGIPMHLSAFFITNSHCLSEIYDDLNELDESAVHIGSTTISVSKTLDRAKVLCEMEVPFVLQDYSIPTEFDDDTEAVKFINTINTMLNDRRLTTWVNKTTIINNASAITNLLNVSQIHFSQLKQWADEIIAK